MERKHGPGVWLYCDDMDRDLVLCSVRHPKWGTKIKTWFHGSEWKWSTNLVHSVFGTRGPDVVTDLWWVPTNGGEIEMFEWVE